MNWDDVLHTLGKIAPTVATALGGPLAGVAVEAIGEVLGISDPTKDKIAAAVEKAQLTGTQVQALRELEMKYQNEEKERGFRYAELTFKDRDSARKANVEGGTQKDLLKLSILLLVVSLGSELMVLFRGLPEGVSELVVGRVLGLMDAVAMLVLTYWYGSTNHSNQKTELLAKAQPISK